MKITALKTNYKPTDIAVGSARSCYFGKHIITPEGAANWDKKNELLNSIFKAGHHTTLMHYHFTFLIEGMSRLLIWRLLHSHPFYNSEQVSQRYAKMKIDNFTYPKNANKEKWQKYYEKMFSYYEELIEKLTPVIEKILPKFQKKSAKKKAQEFARYLLPMGMNAHLYHTINVITALRYITAAKAIPEAKDEAAEFTNQLKQQMLKIDENLAPLIEFAENEKAIFPEIDIEKIKEKHNIKEKVKIFDIVDYDFNLNANYAGVMRLSSMYLDESILGSFNSYIKLSLSADAQNQRHRRSPAIRPKLEDIYKIDYYIPPVIEKFAKDLYEEAINYAYDFFEKEREILGFSEASYALLNAHNIEIIEHDDFNEFAHKAQMRLCYNAQEEIFDIVYNQVKQLKDAGVKAAKNFLPPCAIRYKEGLRPVCPEGDRFCGVKVWKLDFEDYNRII
ncbi:MULTISPECIES: FAD-dependent thymidylate synthase [unclassified Lebetimonas]|uniref:FAD-dependent thymidylate synthase n=1 Tax=unclassified Lebetimonas TaxID=2648158 RepID=UPI000467EBB8|nr:MULTISPECIES: FAD-dependent thymidylate synthase [unclassified Lebetimonas]